MADDLAGYLAGLVLECEGVKGKDKLKELKVDVGQDEPLTIVTNAANVEVGKRVVVATIGADRSRMSRRLRRPWWAAVTSEGMLCDGPMLGWQGGGAGAAALLPESFKPGEAPPRSRPRLDGGGDGDAPAAPVAKSTGPGVDSLFEKKLTKEEKKAAQEKKKAERAAKKAAKGGDAAEEEKSDE
jgi:tRNA-binding EMAP/Myf-like protein